MQVLNGALAGRASLVEPDAFTVADLNVAAGALRFGAPDPVGAHMLMRKVIETSSGNW